MRCSQSRPCSPDRSLVVLAQDAASILSEPEVLRRRPRNKPTPDRGLSSSRTGRDVRRSNRNATPDFEPKPIPKAEPFRAPSQKPIASSDSLADGRHEAATADTGGQPRPETERESESQPIRSTPRRSALNAEAVRRVEPHQPQPRMPDADPRAPARIPNRASPFGRPERQSRSDVKALEKRWEASFENHDVSVTRDWWRMIRRHFLERQGRWKGDMIAEAEERQERLQFRRLARNDRPQCCTGVAVVTGIATETGKTTVGGKPFQAYRFTDTWMERNGKWQCVAASAWRFRRSNAESVTRWTLRRRQYRAVSDLVSTPLRMIAMVAIERLRGGYCCANC